MITLDSEKINAAPNDEARGELIAQSIAEMIEANGGNETIVGILSSCVLNQMITMEYSDYLCQYLNDLAAAAKVPMSPLFFSDWIELKDMTDEQKKAWMIKKRDEFLANRKRIIVPQ